MGGFIVIRPKDDAAARQSSDWCDSLCARLSANGHLKTADIDDLSPPDATHILGAFAKGGELICYFGHGDEAAWLTSDVPTIDTTNVKAARAKSVVSIACKTAKVLGPDAITAGVTCWLGFTIKVPVMSPHKSRDPIGDAIVDGLSGLGVSKSMQQVRDDIYSHLDKLVADFDTGSLSSHPASALGYFSAMSLRDHIVVHGNPAHQPLP
jgi:peptidase C25-like protein